MPGHAWKFGAVLCLLVGMMLAGLAPAASTERPRRAAAALTVTPDSGYVAGQGLVFSGNIGATGSRRVHLQRNAWYSGGAWADVDGFSATTTADGDFRFIYPAPAMLGIRYRVASSGLSTPAVSFEARSQDLTVTAVGDPQAGVPFDLAVDTTPTLLRRPDTIGLQPIVGRTLSLQKRATPTRWTELDTTVVGPQGLAKFTVTEPTGGMHVYRVVAENFSEGGSQIGWFPSFPTYVMVHGRTGRRVPPTTEAQDTTVSLPASTPTGTVDTTRATRTVSRTTAGQTYLWGVSLFDFAWELGESLDAKPYRGSIPRGMWTEYNDGGGRISSKNGGLYFDSQRNNKPGLGDFGTTMATMQGNPMTYGRWEVRLRARSDETAARDYIVRAELVPEDPDDYDCGAHNITVGELTAHGSSVSVGVNAGDRRWSYKKALAGGNNARHFALATEVTKRHITWFIDGRPVATVVNRRAVSDLPMTLRLSMVGDGEREMNRTDVLSDWQRGFSLLRGNFVTNGHRMSTGVNTATC
jgi:hypothetical protein